VGESVDGTAQPEGEPLESSDTAERLPAEIEPAVLRKYFSLTRADLDEVERCRGSANKLGFVMWTFRGRVLKSTVGVASWTPAVRAGVTVPLRVVLQIMPPRAARRVA
jgi:hypothetical protein